MAHEHVLVNVLQVDNVGVVAGPPVEVDLATGLGNVTEDLKGRGGTSDKGPSEEGTTSQ